MRCITATADGKEATANGVSSGILRGVAMAKQFSEQSLQSERTGVAEARDGEGKGDRQTGP